MRKFSDDYYSRIEAVDQAELFKRMEAVSDSPWRQGYHVQPVMGFMASPAAFFFHDGVYHLFYNWHPLSSKNNINYWYHTTSSDLVTFQNKGLKLRPDDLYDAHGLTSGSAVRFKDALYVFYTGFFKKGTDSIAPVQLAAELKPDDKLYKHSVPLIETVPEDIKSIGQPFVFKLNDTYYMFLGIEKDNGYGGIAVYEAVEDYRFEYTGILETNLDTFGDTWEYPGLFSLDGFDILMFSPKGIDKFGYNFWNTYQSGFVIGELNIETLSMAHGTFFEFDYGFDFYAPQVTVDKDGRRILTGLLGMHDTGYPADEYHWVNCMSLPRVLTIENYKLKQRPHPNLTALRGEEIKAEGYFNHRPKRMRDFYGDRYEFIIDYIEYDATEIYLKLRVSKREETVITYNTEQQEITLDTAFSGAQPEGVDGTKRYLKLNHELRQLRIFMDISSIEIFINDGDRVMSSRIFPGSHATGVELSTEMGECFVEMRQYKLKEIEYEKVIYSWRGTD